MPYLFCAKDGLDHEATTIGRQDHYWREGETVLIVKGRLVSGPWQCDSCNRQLTMGDRAILVSAFPSHCHDALYDYNFGYERRYFAMEPGDTATAYGAGWPDDSIKNRRTRHP